MVCCQEKVGFLGGSLLQAVSQNSVFVYGVWTLSRRTFSFSKQRGELRVRSRVKAWTWQEMGKRVGYRGVSVGIDPKRSNSQNEE